ncbi:GxxExxY protein [Gemmatimonas sp.]|uniref:GxxExxY protein n=1 Tax=Gemmatimonas sp. TaxID=1962908 RepID=UPI00286E1276|nr:GxxExxY protein [Gemmatimonas sp.]
MPPINQITADIIDASIHIHADLGPGLFESAYEEVLAAELTRRGLRVQRQQVIPFEYKGTKIAFGFRLDLLIEGRVPVELKCTERPAPIHQRQLLTYLRLMQLPVGLLINFGGDRLIDGVQRIMNGYLDGDERVNVPR